MHLIHESGVGTAYIERDQSGQVVRVALSTEAKDDDGDGEDSCTLPAAVSESSSMPPIMDPWSSANVSAIRLVQKDSSSNDYKAPNSRAIRSAASEAPWLIHGPSFTVRPIPMPAPPEPMVAPTPVPMFPYRPTSSPASSTAPSPALPEPLPVPPPAFRPAPMPASTYKADAITIWLLAQLPKWAIDALCKASECLEAKPSWVIEYALQFLGVVPTPDIYMRLVALLELID
jgi:hypothetical protein